MGAPFYRILPRLRTALETKMYRESIVPDKRPSDIDRRSDCDIEFITFRDGAWVQVCSNLWWSYYKDESDYCYEYGWNCVADPRWFIDYEDFKQDVKNGRMDNHLYDDWVKKHRNQLV
jgi:hypothetical protein